MKTYKYAHIEQFASDCDWLRLNSTDPQVLNWVLAELKKLVPSCRVDWEGKDVSGETYACQINGLKVNREKVSSQVKWWVIRELCKQGWEPFDCGDKFFRLRLESQS